MCKHSVLWRAIAALQTKLIILISTQRKLFFSSFLSSLQVIIYTGDTNATPEQILARVSQTFNITIEHPENLKFTYLRGRYLLEPIRYPYFTLLAQALASILVGFEALWKACPGIINLAYYQQARII
jgi:hypothetical protein